MDTERDCQLGNVYASFSIRYIKSKFEKKKPLTALADRLYMKFEFILI